MINVDEIKNGDYLVLKSGRELLVDGTSFHITEQNILMIYGPKSLYSWGWIPVGEVVDVIKGVENDK